MGAAPPGIRVHPRAPAILGALSPGIGRALGKVQVDMVTAAFLILAILVVIGAALAWTGRMDTGIRPNDRPGPRPLPASPITAEEIAGMKFRVGLRGYRMEDVDAALAALAAELRRRDDAGRPVLTAPDAADDVGDAGIPDDPGGSAE